MYSLSSESNRRSLTLRRRSAFRRGAGFTLIEALVATGLVAVALVGVMGGIRALGQAEVKARDADLLQRLAAQKMGTIGSVDDPTSMDDKGDFTDQGHQEVSWTVDVEPSGAENVDLVTVTATKGDASQSLVSMVYIPPTTTTTDTGATQ